MEIKLPRALQLSTDVARHVAERKHVQQAFSSGSEKGIRLDDT